MQKKHSKWWLSYNKNESAKNERWFFFHHAGGSASSYAQWLKHVPKNVEPLSVELPGRGQRYHEAFPFKILVSAASRVARVF